MTKLDDMGFFAAAEQGTVHPIHEPDPMQVESDGEEETTGSPAPKRRKMAVKQLFANTPSTSEITVNPITTIANKSWREGGKISFKKDLVENIWNDHILTRSENQTISDKSVLILEYNHYLELYLWPFFDANKSTLSHHLSIVLIMNEKFRQKLPISALITEVADQDKFTSFYYTILNHILDDTIALTYKSIMVKFLVNLFQNWSNSFIRTLTKGLVDVHIWKCLVDDSAREDAFEKNEGVLHLFAKMEKKMLKADKETSAKLAFQSTFLSNFMKIFVETLSAIPPSPTADHHQQIAFCNQSLELLTDLTAQLPTRRFFNLLLSDHLILPVCTTSSLIKDNHLFAHLVENLDFYHHFEVDEFSGEAFSPEEITRMHYSKLMSLQKLAFAKYREEGLEEFSVSNIGRIQTRKALKTAFQGLSSKALKSLCQDVRIRTTDFKDNDFEDSFLIYALAEKFYKRISQIEKINSLPLYPDENTLFNNDTVITSTTTTNNTTSSQIFAIPKLNLQFLTPSDYLLRNFKLFRLETSYGIKQDIKDVVERLDPTYDYMPSESSNSGGKAKTRFRGWARMGVEMTDFKIIEVGAPKIGEKKPSFVRADITFGINRYSDAIKREWDQIKPRDVLFLLAVHPTEHTPDVTDKVSGDVEFLIKHGIKSVRGCEVLQLISEEGTVIEEFNRSGGAVKAYLSYQEKMLKEQQQKDSSLPEHMNFIRPVGMKRIYRVLLDTNQYAADPASVYETGFLNVCVRRRGAENNFKPALETIRDLIRSSDIVIPSWLENVFLGYGSPESAYYKNMDANLVTPTMDYRDTFLDWDHLVSSFPDKELVAVDEVGKPLKSSIEPPYVLTFPNSMYTNLEDQPEPSASSSKKKKKTDKMEVDEHKQVVEVKRYDSENTGPFAKETVKKNAIKFTPTQIEAITSGMSPGMTLVVGPPGTGKTDIAVQIISNLYHNHPEQHTLLITHSNQALNQLFEKILALDIDPRHIVRLGHGQDDLSSGENDSEWGKFGRVNYFLEKRLSLLNDVQTLATSLKIQGDYGSSCETAEYLYKFHILTLWEEFVAAHLDSCQSRQEVAKHFPFMNFFNLGIRGNLFPAEASLEESKEIAHGCFRHLKKIFQELEEMRAFELLKSNYERSNYLLMKEAKIVALTCTHASLKRRELIKIGFKYDNVVMEESGQILEIEAFIPLVLQSPETEKKNSDLSVRLKRIVLIGDHHQLPPVIQNPVLQKYGNMEQSLFTRMIRLGASHVQLDRQGRSRPSLADLYRTKYEGLEDLPGKEFESTYNPGFLYDVQLVDVGDFQGKGESEPVPHFLQNLGEAEYVVAVFMYMRLVGYPADKITILTSYNGQRELINDVLNRRSSWHPLFGKPKSVSTIDKYQGQQNDYILLSLVRTQNIGHVRDARRWIVAMSRARLGLYVFGRRRLLEDVVELKDMVEVLKKNGNGKLMLVPGESFEQKDVKDRKGFEIQGVEHIGQYVYKLQTDHMKWLKEQHQQQIENCQQQIENGDQEEENDQEMVQDIDEEI